jgi:hypothetical protein
MVGIRDIANERKTFPTTRNRCKQFMDPIALFDAQTRLRILPYLVAVMQWIAGKLPEPPKERPFGVPAHLVLMIRQEQRAEAWRRAAAQPRPAPAALAKRRGPDRLLSERPVHPIRTPTSRHEGSHHDHPRLTTFDSQRITDEVNDHSTGSARSDHEADRWLLPLPMSRLRRTASNGQPAKQSGALFQLRPELQQHRKRSAATGGVVS